MKKLKTIYCNLIEKPNTIAALLFGINNGRVSFSSSDLSPKYPLIQDSYLLLGVAVVKLAGTTTPHCCKR
jgi:hypothetical protein